MLAEGSFGWTLAVGLVHQRVVMPYREPGARRGPSTVPVAAFERSTWVAMRGGDCLCDGKVSGAVGGRFRCGAVDGVFELFDDFRQLE